MSQRPGNDRPPSASSPSQRHSRPSRPPSPPPTIGQQYGSSRPGSVAGPLAASMSPTLQRVQQQQPQQQQRGSSARPFELPPLPQISPPSSGSFSPTASTRAVSMVSILNPGHGPSDVPPARRRKVSELESPPATGAALPPLLANPRDRSSSHAVPTTTSATTLFPHAAERRILTPRSPSLRHSASLNQLNAPSASSSIQPPSFIGSPRSRAYFVEPGVAGAPPLPSYAPPPRPGPYGFAAPSPRLAPRRASFSAARITRQPSSSASPSTSHSGFSHAGQMSPATAHPTSISTMTSAYSGPEPTTLFAADHPAHTSASAAPERLRSAGGIPITSSSGPNVFQMMTYETESGAVQLPVDVHAASRVADEKRKRNAGASARFRQRRKEKEKEASSTIARLEQQVKDLGEDVDFYRRERDYFVGVTLQVAGGERHFPRPTSPRLRRPAAPTSAVAGSSGSVHSPYQTGQEHSPRVGEEERNVKRRTSSLLPPPPPPPQPIAGLSQPAPSPQMHAQQQQQPPAYPLGPPAYGQPILPHLERRQHQYSPPIPSQSAPPQSQIRPGNPGSAALGMNPPPSQQQQQHQQQQQPHLMQASPQTGPWNPYAAAERRPPGPAPPPGSSHRDDR